jgi:YD repeat-containing protein
MSEGASDCQLTRSGMTPMTGRRLIGVSARQHLNLGCLLPAIASLLLCTAARSEQTWTYTWPYDGTSATGSWATVKDFSERKDADYYRPQGLAASCVWVTPEPIPQHTIADGIWGGTYVYNGQTYPCTGHFGVTWVSCPEGQGWVPQANACKPIVDVNRQAAAANNACGAGNPIYPLLGTKRESVDLRLALGGLNLRLTYDSSARAPVWLDGRASADPNGGALGQLWFSSLHRRVLVQGAGQGALVARGDGHVVVFSGNGTGVFTAEADNNDRLVTVSGGYRYIDAANQSEETYNSLGNLSTISWANGDSVVLTYSDATTPPGVAPAPGYLIQAQDNRGRLIQFVYQLPAGAPPATGGRLASITDATGQAINLSYDAQSNLASITWADATARQFLYENPASPWALTGIADERAVRYATFGYDTAGRAISTEYSGGVNRYSAAYTVLPVGTVTEVYDTTRQVIVRYHDWVLPQGTQLSNPQGATVGIGATSVLGKSYVASRSQPAGSGCAASTSATTYGSNGNAASVDDFNGQRVCYGYDVTRNLESVRVEGLATTQSCPTLLPAGASLPAGSRKVSTQWHPDWTLPASVAEPGRLTTYVYNGQPDPFNGNAIATCAPAAATLPDGKPVAVLCRKVEQATTDPNGGASFGVPAVPGDPYIANVSLLLHMDGANGSSAFVDSSQSPKVVSAFGNASISNAISLFGAAGQFDGNGDFLTVPHSPAVDLATGDFTIEMWVRLNATGPNAVIIDKANATSYYPYQISYVSGRFMAIGFDTGTSQAYNMLGTTTAVAGAWYHLSLTRAGSAFRLFVNGAQEGSATFAGSLRSRSRFNRRLQQWDVWLQRSDRRSADHQRRGALHGQLCGPHDRLCEFGERHSCRDHADRHLRACAHADLDLQPVRPGADLQRPSDRRVGRDDVRLLRRHGIHRRRPQRRRPHPG